MHKAQEVSYCKQIACQHSCHNNFWPGTAAWLTL